MERPSEFRKTWIDGFKNYAVSIARISKSNPEEILNCMGFESVVGSLNETYQSLVSTRELRPIEAIDEAEKRELWERSKKYSSDVEHRKLICRSVYLLNELTR